METTNQIVYDITKNFTKIVLQTKKKCYLCNSY